MAEKKDIHVEQVAEGLTFMPVVETIGTKLRKVREEKKIELKDVAKELCIRESFLNALEEGEYSDFPALVYCAGFLKSYAIYLGLDDKEIMQQFHKETEFMIEKSTEAPVIENKNVVPSKKLLLLILLIVSVVFSCFYFFKKDENKVEPLTTVDVVAKVEQKSVEPSVDSNPVAVEEVKTTETLVPDQESATKIATPQQEPVKEEVKKTNATTVTEDLKALVPTEKKDVVEPLENKVVTETATPEVIEPVAYGAKNGARLSFVATDKVWIEIKNGEKIVFNRVLNNGDSYHVAPYANEYLMKVANAGALAVYIDGTFKKVLGKKGVIARDVVLDIEEYED